MAINNDDLDRLVGNNNFQKKAVKSIDEGDQTIDKVKSIVEGVATILNRVQSFKEKTEATKMQNVPEAKVMENVPQSAPVDMQSNKRGILKIDEIKLVEMIKTFGDKIPQPFQEMSLKDLLSEINGNENTIKSFAIPLIKEIASVEYVE